MDDIIILVDENGEEQEYEVLDTVEYEGERYVVLIQEDDDEVSVLKIESEDGDDLELVVCEDDVIEESTISLKKIILTTMILTTKGL